MDSASLRICGGGGPGGHEPMTVVCGLCGVAPHMTHDTMQPGPGCQNSENCNWREDLVLDAVRSAETRTIHKIRSAFGDARDVSVVTVLALGLWSWSPTDRVN